MTSPRSTPYQQNSDLVAEFQQLAGRLNVAMGLAVAAVGGDEPPATFGDWQRGPAWSTSKVPLAIAAYRQQHAVTDAMKAAITCLLTG